jgi:hypothetical protein
VVVKNAGILILIFMHNIFNLCDAGNVIFIILVLLKRVDDIYILDSTHFHHFLSSVRK